ncbi:MAG: SRPBCC family protein [Solirubrobacterales bacterium]
MSTSAKTIRCESRLAIGRSVFEVWDYICDVGRWPQWAPTVQAGWVAGGGPLAPGARVEQRAKLIFGATRYRAQHVTAVEPPRSLAFAGPLGTSTARWGMEFAPIDGVQTEAEMWVEVDLRNVMRALPRRAFRDRIQRVMDIEMIAIKASVESMSLRDGSPVGASTEHPLGEGKP